MAFSVSQARDDFELDSHVYAVEGRRAWHNTDIIGPRFHSIGHQMMKSIHYATLLDGEFCSVDWVQTKPGSFERREKVWNATRLEYEPTTVITYEGNLWDVAH